MQNQSISELYDEFQNTSTEIMSEMNSLLNLVLNQSENIIQTDTNADANADTNADTSASVSTSMNANHNIVSECKDIIYPMNFENINSIESNKRLKILNSCNVIALLFDSIWNVKYNKNFIKVINYSQVIYFFNSNVLYTTMHETYSYEYFFNRMIDVLYEFVYDLHLERKFNENDVIFYISKIRKIDKEGYKSYIHIIKDKLKLKYFEYSSNKYIIEKYEKYITRKNNGNYTDEYLNLKNYINEYTKKKNTIDTFMLPYIIKYEQQLSEIKKQNFASLYIIPEFLL